MMRGTLKGLCHGILGNSIYFRSLRALNFKLAEQSLLLAKSRPRNKQG